MEKARRGEKFGPGQILFWKERPGGRKQRLPREKRAASGSTPSADRLRRRALELPVPGAWPSPSPHEPPASTQFDAKLRKSGAKHRTTHADLDFAAGDCSTVGEDYRDPELGRRSSVYRHFLLHFTLHLQPLIDLRPPTLIFTQLNRPDPAAVLRSSDKQNVSKAQSRYRRSRPHGSSPCYSLPRPDAPS